MAGCATVSEVPNLPEVKSPPPIAAEGVYHKVKHGQTLWRIAKTYDVPMGDIIKTNNIPDIAQVEEDQLLFIPGAKEIKDVVILSAPEEDDKEFAWPIKGKVISSFKSYRSNRINKGIDIEAFEGDQAKAARSGRVVFADNLIGYGQTVIIDHLDGFQSVYSQNVKILVKLGDTVKKGDAIAVIGKSEEIVYLHFEIRKNSQENNPLYYLP